MIERCKVFHFVFFLNFTLASSLALAHGTDQNGTFEGIEQRYLKECGGKIYSKCDDSNGLNQQTLFNSAADIARTSGRKVFAIFGADWCPSCRELKRRLDSNAEIRGQIEKSFVIVEINGTVNSGMKVISDLSVNLVGFPSAVLYDPATGNKTSEGFFPTAVSIEELPGFLERGGKSENKTTKREGFVGNVRSSLLETPIKPAQPGFGTSRFIPSTQLTGELRERFIREAQSGMLYLHGFWWIEAARAFNSALQLEPQNATIQALKGLALKEIESSTDDDYSLNLVQSAKNSTFPVDKDDRAMIISIYFKICKQRDDGCKDNLVIKNNLSSLLAGVLKSYQFTKPDYIALLGYETSNIDMVKASLVKDPGNVGARHYLTHLFEAKGDIEGSAREAKIHATIAPLSPHAQHMYGHILPQQGKWEEATTQFRRADLLQRAEFASGQHLKSEDWHYSHNVDLMVGTLIFQGRFEEASKLLKDGCDFSSNINCNTKVSLLVAMGEYQLADDLLSRYYGQYKQSASLFLENLMIALGKKNLSEAESLLKANESSADFDDKHLIYAKVAIQTILRKADIKNIEDSLSKLKSHLETSGFDSWSHGILYSRMLTRILNDYNRQDLADRVLKVTVGAGGTGACHGAGICTARN